MYECYNNKIMKNILKSYLLFFFSTQIRIISSKISPQFTDSYNFSEIKSPISVTKIPKQNNNFDKNIKNININDKNYQQNTKGINWPLSQIKEIINLNKKILEVDNTKYFIYLLEFCIFVYSLYYSENIKSKENIIKVIEINFSKRIFIYILTGMILNQFIINIFLMKSNKYIIVTSFLISSITILDFYNNKNTFNFQNCISLGFIIVTISLINYLFCKIISLSNKQNKSLGNLLNKKKEKIIETYGELNKFKHNYKYSENLI